MLVDFAVFVPCELQSSLEHDVYSRLSSLQEGLIPKKRAGGADDDLHRINELIQVPTRASSFSTFLPSFGCLLQNSSE